MPQLTLGDLQVYEELGKGGFGVVHRARLAHVDLDFAIKFLDPHPFNRDHETALKRFFQEAELLFRFRHQYIVPIYGVGEHEGRPYILMEYFKGVSVAAVRNGTYKYTPSEVIVFLMRIAEGLVHAHEQNVVHRDIKPSNLMTKQGDARILDFGIAALLDPAMERLTRTGATVTGDAYSAPELLADHRLVDPRCDIYSLGACWYWLLTGRPPTGHNLQSLLRQTIKVDRDYEDVLLRCLDQVEARYQSANELVADLRALRDGTRPAQNPREMDDTSASVVGIVFEICDGASSSASLYQLEQRIGSQLSKVRLNATIRILIRRGFLEQDIDTDFNGNDYVVLKCTDAGATWVEEHLDRVEGLLRDLQQKTLPPPDDDDVPF